jgi:hypothetical protein
VTDPHTTRTIVNRIGELLYEELRNRGVDGTTIVEARQATNDEADRIVSGILRQVQHDTWNEGAIAEANRWMILPNYPTNPYPKER